VTRGLLFVIETVSTFFVIILLLGILELSHLKYFRYNIFVYACSLFTTLELLVGIMTMLNRSKIKIIVRIQIQASYSILCLAA
jgi:hypothetical protein